MKKLFFLFSFMLCLTFLASAQTSKLNEKQKHLRANQESAIINQSKNDAAKKALLAKPAQNLIKGADQLASEAEQQKIKNKR